ncbi:hypothetical protein Tco_1085502 [Tanacetum coccineum]
MDLMSSKMESQKSLNDYTPKINDLNQTILEMKKKLFAHQETIFIMSQEKEAQTKFHKTREDKELEKIIALENKIKALDDIVYKTGQSVQTMNMLNRCYNDNLALMLAPESDETIRLAQESRSKLKRSKMSHTPVKNENSKESFNKQTTLLEKRMDESIPEYYYADHMNAILGVYTTLDEFTDLQCDYVDQVVKCERLEKELSKSNITSKSFEALQQHAIDLELALQQCQEQIKNDKAFKENQSNVFLKEREQYFEIQDLKAQLQDKGIAIRVISTTSISRSQLKSNRLEDRVLHNNSEGKKQQVEDHRKNFKTKMPMAVPICTREPKRTVNQSVATPLERTIDAESTNQKPRSTVRKLYEYVSKTCSWSYPKFTPSGYTWKPKSSTMNVKPNVSMPLGNKSRTTNILETTTLRNPLYQILHHLLILLQLVEIILFVVDSGCSKHMTGNLKLLSNFVEQFLGTVKFGNDQIAPILSYGDLVQGNITIKGFITSKG